MGISPMQWSARRLLDLFCADDDEAMLDELSRLAAAPQTLRAVTGELVAALAQMLRAVDPGTGEPAFGVELVDDEGATIGIDDMRPPLRAAVRAVLAELNGHPEDAMFQIELATTDGDLHSTVDLVGHVLTWTSGLLDWCDDARRSGPAWLAHNAPHP